MENIKGRLKVSVLVTTYNHEKYIREALDGILMQEVDFDYNIVIHDDASTDKTQDIIREYENKYSDIIVAIYQRENKYSKGINRQQYYLPYLTGEYIAVCEGDDYWTNPYKLKKQVDFLEKHTEYIATAHNVRVIDENYIELDEKLHTYKKYDDHVFTQKDALEFKLPGQLASLVYRNIWADLDKKVIDLYRKCKANGDQKLAVLLTSYGDIFCFSDIMADHRKIVSHGSSWSARTHGKNLSFYIYRSMIEIKEFAEKAFSIRVNNKKQTRNIYIGALLTYIKKPTKENKKILKQINEIRQETYIEIILYFIFKIITYPIRLLYKKLQ